MLNISPFLDSQNLSLLFFRNEPIILRLFSDKIVSTGEDSVGDRGETKQLKYLSLLWG